MIIMGFTVRTLATYTVRNYASYVVIFNLTRTYAYVYSYILEFCTNNSYCIVVYSYWIKCIINS